MREFAEQEIVIPTGKYEDQKFSCRTQPFSGLWFDAVDSGIWPRMFATGPVQSGKSLCGFVIPIAYHICELKEDVIVAVPKAGIADAKWKKDILPVLQRTRYARILPDDGPGSKGGQVNSLYFKNGAVLHFMTAGGGDKSRASLTARVLVVTEVDGFDETSETSRESSKFDQLEGRLFSRTASERRLYAECTVSIETGRTWVEYSNGTASRIALPCPACDAWVTPARANLGGWQDCEDIKTVQAKAHWSCPACGAVWTEPERLEANLAGRLVHRGQTIDEKGNLQGEQPRTDTLGFRWEPVHNMFLQPGDVAGEEWKAARAIDEENANRRLMQFVWALPYKPPRVDMTALKYEVVKKRQGRLRKGIVPADTLYSTLHIDVGKWWCHWLFTAFRSDKTYHVVDYGLFECPSDDLPTRQAILLGLRNFRESILAGWITADKAVQQVPDLVTVDRRYEPDAVDAFIRESNAMAQPANASGILRFWPVMGFGFGKDRNRWYASPKSVTKSVPHIGQEYYVAWHEQAQLLAINVNADHWKKQAQDALGCGQEQPGAIVLYQTDAPNGHHKFAKHTSAERPVQEYSPTQGMVTRWVTVSRENHLGDCLYNTLMSLHFMGARVIEEPEGPAAGTPGVEGPRLTTADGRPYMVTERT